MRSAWGRSVFSSAFSAAGATRVVKKPIDLALLFADLGLPAPRKPV